MPINPTATANRLLQQMAELGFDDVPEMLRPIDEFTGESAPKIVVEKSARTSPDRLHPVAGEVPSSDYEVPASESEPTSFDFLKKSNKCRATGKKSNARCKAWTMRGSEYCIYHDPDRAEGLRQAQSRGGQATRRSLAVEMDELDFNLFDRGGIQAALGHAVRMQLLGKLPPRQASHLVKLLALVVSNARDMPVNTDEREVFSESMEGLLDAADLIADRLENRELRDRIDAIEDHGARRQEYLKANETFGYLPPNQQSKMPAPSRTPSVGYGPNDIRPFFG